MNIINDSWLTVEYLDGSQKTISVRTLFKEAEQIKTLVTPNFHNTTIYLYDVPVMQFLTVLLLSAYFKPETNFQSGDKYFSKRILENGWDNSVISAYLDKWQDRFNLFDENYPFLQEIKLKDREYNEESTNYILQCSPIAPAANNTVFEGVSLSEGQSISSYYAFTEQELVYLLLYTAMLGVSIMPAQYKNKSLLCKHTMFLLLQGKNLKETIIYNALPLLESSRPNEDTELYDKPIWEFDNKDEINDYDLMEITNNHLLCSFFPSMPLYVHYDNGIKSIVVAKEIKDAIVDEKTRDQIAQGYLLNNPFTINKMVEDKDGTKTFSPREWGKDLKISNLCTEITKKVPKSLCRLISSDIQDNHGATCFIYYRTFDKYKSNVYACGRYELPQDVFDILQVEKNYDIAVEYQDMVAKIKGYLEFFKTEVSTSKMEEMKTLFAQRAESYFFHQFIDNIDKETILLDCYTYLSTYAKQLIDDAMNSYISNPVSFAKVSIKAIGCINKLQTKYMETENGN